MAYDPVKAHEYYVKYRKKGLLKGRKKGSKKKTSSKKKSKTIALIGVSSAGLNSDGAIEAALIKEKLKKEMNDALEKAKTDEEKIAIRKEFSKKANAEIDKLRSDPKFAKAKAQKATKTSSSSNRGSSGSRSSSPSSTPSTSTTTTSPSTSSNKSSSTKTSAKKTNAKKTDAKTVSEIDTILDDIVSSVDDMTDEKKEALKTTLTGMIEVIKGLLSGGGNTEWISGIFKQNKT